MQSTLHRQITEAELLELRNGLEIIALRMLRDVEGARDAVQETILRILEMLQEGRLPHSSSLGAFAYGVLRHVAIDMQRRAGREQPLPEGKEPADRGTSALDRLVNEQEIKRMRHALQGLSPADRELLERCYIEGRRLSEIARESGEPEGRVRVRKLRALERLRRLFGSNESAPGPTSRQ